MDDEPRGVTLRTAAFSAFALGWVALTLGSAFAG